MRNIFRLLFSDFCYGEEMSTRCPFQSGRNPKVCQRIENRWNSDRRVRLFVFFFFHFFNFFFCDGYDLFYVICLFFILKGSVKKQKQGIYYPI